MHVALRRFGAGVKIGEAARASGVSARSLRFYEAEGLIDPGRRRNGYRDYCESTLGRVRLIRSLLTSGLSVSLIKELLPHLTQAEAPEAATLCAEFRAAVGVYRDRLAERIAVLEAQRSALDSYLDGSDPSLTLT